jgi:hypothetical protein
MNGSDTSPRFPLRPRRLGHRELVDDHYEGVDIAPQTQDSLITWDVSGRARREQDRWRSVDRIVDRTGGY